MVSNSLFQDIFTWTTPVTNGFWCPRLCHEKPRRFTSGPAPYRHTQPWRSTFTWERKASALNVSILSIWFVSITVHPLGPRWTELNGPIWTATSAAKRRRIGMQRLGPRWNQWTSWGSLTAGLWEEFMTFAAQDWMVITAFRHWTNTSVCIH